jgi:hypothetical protein
MHVIGGATYWIVVDGEPEGGTGAMGTFTLSATMVLAPSPPGPGGGASASVAAPAGYDTTAPGTTIGKRQVRSRARSARFAFAADEAGSTFRCRLDGHKPIPCGSPKSFTGLAWGPHTFKVYAVDPAGNADPTPATVRFSIVRPRQGQK